MNFDAKIIWKHSDKVATRQIGDELLVIPIRSSPSQPMGVSTLNHTASALWHWMDGTRDFDALVLAMCERFQVDEEQARADVEVCCSDLLALGAIEDAQSP